MDLAAQYDALRQAALPKIAHGEAAIDAFIDNPADTRRGITLLARPPAHITKAIEALLADFRPTEPDQYYYPTSDIHLTILSIISCYSGFALRLIDPEAYQTAVRTITQSVPPFSITYSGLTASPGGIMLQGFPQAPGLENLRAATRQYFQHSGLLQSIDQRYSLQTAHSTIIRFRHKLRNPSAMLDKIRQYQHQFIGTFEVNAIELVFNDWYQRAENTVLLEQYSLG